MPWVLRQINCLGQLLLFSRDADYCIKEGGGGEKLEERCADMVSLTFHHSNKSLKCTFFSCRLMVLIQYSQDTDYCMKEGGGRERLGWG